MTTHRDAHAGRGDGESVLRLLAQQADRRARRRAATLPMMAQMGAAALASELTMLASDQEKLLSALHLPARSLLRPVASALPEAARRTAAAVVRCERLGADVLARLAPGT